MTVLNSLYVGVFGMTVVFVVLIGLSLMLKLLAVLTKRFSPASPVKETSVMELDISSEPAAIAEEPLKLVQVDEKTAALIMAIVCDELKAQPEELNFKSIRAINDK
jgi:Na+-transporting methylmalonyl-CoA/oxaloacetate decarboxylase gamma subunit